MDSDSFPVELSPDRLTGDVRALDENTPLDGATRYEAESVGSGLRFDLPDGVLSAGNFLTFDALLDGDSLGVYALRLREESDDSAFTVTYGILPQASARIRLPLELTDQNRWAHRREGAWLKPTVSGDRVDPERADELSVEVYRKSEGTLGWCQTPVTVTVREPPRLTEPTLPEGPLVDELGQSTLREWTEKSRGLREVIERLRRQRENATEREWPASFSEWGGASAGRFEPTGYFRTERDGDRWWLVGPEGRPFWSAGVNCVGWLPTTAFGGLEDALEWRPGPDGRYAEVGDGETVSFLGTNLVRTFGPEDWDEEWSVLLVGLLRRIGFNTVGNWSDWEVAREFDVPYVRPIHLEFPRTPYVYRDFPDVFHPDLQTDAADLADGLAHTSDDSGLVGYFLGNEPAWCFSEYTPAEGMLYATETCRTRQRFAEFLRERHGDDGTLSESWGVRTSFREVATGRWNRRVPDGAATDLEAFSERMVTRLYRTLSDACRAVDPNHLNLGSRFHSVPPEWVVSGIEGIDVFSVNCYENRLPASELAAVSAATDCPILVGEWHFGALDVGLPASGLRRVRSQAARGAAYRAYLEDAAAKPWCVGAHYFSLYDQPVLGRFDGENGNIGFLDVCHRPYEPLLTAARSAHERLYDLATGDETPFDDEPEYLPPLFP